MSHEPYEAMEPAAGPKPAKCRAAFVKETGSSPGADQSRPRKASPHAAALPPHVSPGGPQVLRVGGAKRVEAVVVRVKDGRIGLHFLEGLRELLPHGVAPARIDSQNAGGDKQRSIDIHGLETRPVDNVASTAIACSIPNRAAHA
jgi:hypothetical protein